MKRLVSGWALLGTLVASASARADGPGYSPLYAPFAASDAPDPPPRAERSRPRRKGDAWLTAGSLFFAIPYGVSATGALGSGLVGGPGRYTWLAAPGVGPLPLMVETSNAAGNVVLSLDALSQLSGIGMITYGFILRATSKEGAESAGAALPFTLAPMMGRGQSGLVAVGWF